MTTKDEVVGDLGDAVPLVTFSSPPVYLGEGDGVLHMGDMMGADNQGYLANDDNEKAAIDAKLAGNVNHPEVRRGGDEVPAMSSPTGFLEKIGDLAYTPKRNEVSVKKCNVASEVTSNIVKMEEFALHHACAEGSVEVLEELIAVLKEEGDEECVKMLNQLDKKALRPLHYAAMYNREKCMKMLLDHGVHVDSRGGSDDVTPLHLSTMYKMVEGGKYLIQNAGANVELSKNNGTTALHMAAKSGCLPLVTCLLEQGASSSVVDSGMNTPLHMSMYSGDVTVASMIIQHGADIRARNAEGEMPIHLAAEDRPLLVRLLADAAVAEVDVGKKNEVLSSLMNVRTAHHDTPLHIATHAGYLDTVQVLLEFGADPNSRNGSNASPLHLASIGGHVEITQLLIDRGGVVNCRDEDGSQPLHKACRYGHVTVARLLHQSGGDIDGGDGHNYTPLMYGVRNGHEEVVGYLLQHNAQLHHEDNNGLCAIHLAVEENQIKMLNWLLDIEGIDQLKLVDDPDKSMKRPLHYAAKLNDSEAIAVLLEKGADISLRDNEEMSALHVAAKEGHAECVRLLADASPESANYRDAKGRSPLHLAAICGHRAATTTLIEMGSEVSMNDEEQWTPLDYAARNGYPKIMTILMANDAVVDCVDRNMTTPLHLAAEYGHSACVQVLLDQGADVKLLNNDQKNCLELAIENSHEEACQVILQHERWLEALHHVDSTNTPIIDKLIKNMPEVCEYVLNKSMEKTTHLPPTHTDYNVKYNLQVLDSHPDDVSYFAPATMVSEKRYSLLTHPLTVRLVNEKWSRLGLWGYLPSLMLYVFFVVLLTVLLIVDKHRNVASVSPMGPLTVTRFDKNGVQEVFPWIILVLAVVQLLKEVSQIVVHKSLYFKDADNYLEWLLYGLCITFIVPFIIQNLDKGVGRLNDNHAGKLGSITPGWHGSYQSEIKLPFVGTVIVKTDLNLTIDAQGNIRSITTQDKAPPRPFTLEGSVDFTTGAVTFIKSYGNDEHTFTGTMKNAEIIGTHTQGGAFMVKQEFVADPALLEYYNHLETVKWQVGPLVILIVWMNLLLYLKRIPTFGIPVIMFLKVFQTLLQVLLVFFILIMAFSFSFYVLLDGVESFKFPARSIFKTSMMTLGELGYSGLFVSNYDTPNLPYQQVSFIIFFVFIIIMPVLFMNLLVGLAVGDIDMVRKQAYVVILKNMVNLLDSICGNFPRWLLRQRYRSQVIDYPNKMKGCKALFENFGSMDFEDIQEETEGDESEVQMMSEVNENKSELKKQKKRLKNMQDLLEKYQDVSQTIFQHCKCCKNCNTTLVL